jgi:hypothetical protein
MREDLLPKLEKKDAMREELLPKLKSAPFFEASWRTLRLRYALPSCRTTSNATRRTDLPDNNILSNGTQVN